MICHEKPTGVPLMGGHRWRVRAAFPAGWVGLAAGQHPEVGVGVAVGGDLDTFDQLAKQLLYRVGVAVLDGPVNLGAERAELLGGGELVCGVLQLAGQLLAMSGQLVAARPTTNRQPDMTPAPTFDP